MTPSEMKKREEIVKSMKKSFPDFRKRYGAQAKSVMYATATKQAMKEAVDDEGNMARGQLMKMAKQATSLAMMMHDDKQLDGWVQSKLTMASDYLDSVHDYLMNNVQDVDKMQEGEHLCAKHVYSDVFGEGVVLEAEHAEPDENGNIEWYTVEFEHGKETVFTEDIKVMHAEMHGNHKKKKMAEGPVDQMHYCATHVEHKILGKGTCISEQHAQPDENGNIEWYTVEFPSGIHKMFTENLNILQAESHMHSKKKMKEASVDEMSSKMKMKMGLYNKKNEALSGDQHKIDMNKNNKIDAQDFAMLRKIKKARGM